jgi:hypothetical protein
METGFGVGERRLPVRAAGKVERGTAVHLNLPPLRYLQYREKGKADPSQRQLFLEHVLAAVKPRVAVTSAGARPRNCEVTYWTRDNRTLLFIVQKTPPVATRPAETGPASFSTRKSRSPSNSQPRCAASWTNGLERLSATGEFSTFRSRCWKR